MKAIHKKLNDGGSFPVRLVYKDTKSPQMELPHHLHDWFEIIYVYSGSGTMLINHTFYTMNRGTLFLIPGNTVHRAFPDEDKPVTSSALFFNPALILMDWGGQDRLYRNLQMIRREKFYKLVIPESDQRALELFLESIHEELSEEEKYYQTAVQINICHFILTLSRLYLPGSSIVGDSSSEPTWMQETLHYIDANISDQQLTLAYLSQRVSISASHFSRVFKQTTGMNTSEYIVIKRIMLAKELLVLTDMNISAICERCGIQSESYFYRQFKQLTGLTPRAYRKSLI